MLCVCACGVCMGVRYCCYRCSNPEHRSVSLAGILFTAACGVAGRRYSAGVPREERRPAQGEPVNQTQGHPHSSLRILKHIQCIIIIVV